MSIICFCPPFCLLQIFFWLLTPIQTLLWFLVRGLLFGRRDIWIFMQLFIMTGIMSYNWIQKGTWHYSHAGGNKELAESNWVLFSCSPKESSYWTTSELSWQKFTHLCWKPMHLRQQSGILREVLWLFVKVIIIMKQCCKVHWSFVELPHSEMNFQP